MNQGLNEEDPPGDGRKVHENETRPTKLELAPPVFTTVDPSTGAQANNKKHPQMRNKTKVPPKHLRCLEEEKVPEDEVFDSNLLMPHSAARDTIIDDNSHASNSYIAQKGRKKHKKRKELEDQPGAQHGLRSSPEEVEEGSTSNDHNSESVPEDEIVGDDNVPSSKRHDGECDDEEHLVVARPAKQLEIAEGTPVVRETTDQLRQERTWNGCVWIACLLAVVGALALSLGLVLPSNRNDEVTASPTNAPTKSKIIISPETVSPSSSPSLAPTVSPSPTMEPTSEPTISVFPTVAPSITPSLDPTITPSTLPSLLPTTTEDLAISMLSAHIPDIPNGTIQLEALDWLINNDGEELIVTQKSDLLLDRYVMVILYLSTNGEGWINNRGWLTQESVCNWRSICRDGRVRYMVFHENNLVGTIPTEIGVLTAIEVLNFRDNDLSGRIPSHLGSLTTLTAIQLAFNGLVGTIPAEISTLTALTRLALDNNDLTGIIPTTIGALTALMELSLDSNDLSGTIPTELGALTALTFLSSNFNALTGTIPSEIATLTALTALALRGGTLTAALTGLELNAKNGLTGFVPTEAGLLTNLKSLALGGNNLSGTIPLELVRSLTALTGLWLDRNSLSGTVPTEVGALTALATLCLSNNGLEGTIPSEIGQLLTLTGLFLSNNTLTGTFPQELDDILEGLNTCWLGCNDDLYGIPSNCQCCSLVLCS